MVVKPKNILAYFLKKSQEKTKKGKTMKNLFSSKKSKKKAILGLIIIIILIILTVIVSIPIAKAFSSPTAIRNFVSQFGVYSALVFIIILILQLIFAVIPSTPIVIAGGYMFGPYLGMLLSVIGNLLASMLVFGVTRLFGRPFVESIINKSVMEKIDQSSNSIAKTLFVLYLIPILPHDAFTYIAGLTNIKFKKFVLVVLIGRLPSILFLSVIGYQLTQLSLLFSIILLAIVVIGGVLIFYQRKNIEDHLHKHLSNIQNKLKK